MSTNRIKGILSFQWNWHKPILREANPANGTSALYADFTVNCIWAAGRAATSDNRIINTDASSFVAYIM